jgi:hypothetical protein
MQADLIVVDQGQVLRHALVLSDPDLFFKPKDTSGTDGSPLSVNGVEGRPPFLKRAHLKASYRLMNDEIHSSCTICLIVPDKLKRICRAA